MNQPHLLIIDDEADLLQGLRRMLCRSFPDLVIHTETDIHKAVDLVEREPVNLVLLDIQMPQGNGLDLLLRLQRLDPGLTVIMMTGYGSIETAIKAMKGGAYDYITKPFDKSALCKALEKGLEHNRLIRENIHLRRRIGEQQPLVGLIGQSKPMQRLFHVIRTAAGSDYTVLIRGESGTGKELTARAIHGLSKRQAQPLVMVNCPAIPEHLLESELFGHKKGSFTGADRDQPGLFAEAEGSSLCLDEIGDIPVSVQTKLLRALQEQEIKPIGSTRTRSMDVRIIASTNRPLEEKIRDHSFREDLYYRLNVVTVQTPSLREIREDIPLLVDHFTRQVCRELEMPEKRFSPAALDEMLRRDWPGNVRQLQNAVRSAVLFCPDESISARYLRCSGAPGAENGRELRTDASVPLYKDAKEQSISSFTRDYVCKLLEETGGNISRAATISGLTRAALQKIMRRHGIRVKESFGP